MKRKLFTYLRVPQVVFAKFLYRKASKINIKSTTIKNLIDLDMKRYFPKGFQGDNRFLLTYLLLNNKVFRTQFYFRIQQDNRLGSSFIQSFSKVFLPPLENIQVGINKSGFIDGGLFIVHSSGCVISVHNAGKNLTVYQGVTIGDSGEKNSEGYKNPVFGDNVTVFANAVVAGGIRIGNNSQIGAGSVILNDVPDNCIVVGNPAYIIRMNGEKVRIKL